MNENGNATTAPTTTLPPLDDPSIHIVNDSDFASQAQEQGWAGTGTQIDPFIIENQNIEDSAHCIRIIDVAAYFVIWNCVLRCFEPGQGIGIYIQNSTNGVVESCDVSAGLSGVELFLSHNFVIKNCHVFSPIFAVNMSSSHDNQILDNDIESDFFTLSVICSNRTLIQNNTIHGLDVGIVSQWSWNSTVRSNWIEMNNTGIDLQLRCHDWLLTNNTITVREIAGIRVSKGFSLNIIYGNRLSCSNGTNAIDDGEENSWDDGFSVGNWWSDYEGVGEYVIPGEAGSADHYPRKLD